MTYKSNPMQQTKRNRMFGWRVAVALLMMFFEVNCSTPVHPEDSDYDFSENELQKRFRQIDPSDGIDRSEACVLSYIYFCRFEGLCGFANLEAQTSNEWIFGTAVGYTGAPGADIKIGKQSGIIRQKGRKPIQPPWPELQELFSGIWTTR